MVVTHVRLWPQEFSASTMDPNDLWRPGARAAWPRSRCARRAQAHWTHKWPLGQPGALAKAWHFTTPALSA
eukprot:4192324-Pyramimonas_sp.AAC.1